MGSLVRLYISISSGTGEVLTEVTQRLLLVSEEVGTLHFCCLFLSSDPGSVQNCGLSKYLVYFHVSRLFNILCRQVCMCEKSM